MILNIPLFPETKNVLFEFHDLSSGCDEVLASVFKKIFDIVSNLILHICNRSLAVGVFPNRLMLALIVFIFKAGDPTLLTNYRPISLLNVISKNVIISLLNVIRGLVLQKLHHYELRGTILEWYRSYFSGRRHKA